MTKFMAEELAPQLATVARGLIARSKVEGDQDYALAGAIILGLCGAVSGSSEHLNLLSELTALASKTLRAKLVPAKPLTPDDLTPTLTVLMDHFGDAGENGTAAVLAGVAACCSVGPLAMDMMAHAMSPCLDEIHNMIKNAQNLRSKFKEN